MTSIRDVRKWFRAWLEHHTRIFLHIEFPPLGEPGSSEAAAAKVFYGPWIDELAAAGATYELACEASSNLRRKEKYQGSIGPHLPGLGAEIRALRARIIDAPPSPPPNECRARLDSAGCPECGACGFARRRATHRLVPGWAPMTPLYCRCPLGRYLVDRDQAARNGPSCDDLQALPELWHPTWSHPTWSDVPAARTRDAFAFGESVTRYLRPEEEDRAKTRPPEPTKSPPTAERESKRRSLKTTMNGSSRQC